MNLVEITEINKHGYIGFKFSGSKRFASAKTKTDKAGRIYFVSKGKKYFVDEVK